MGLLTDVEKAELRAKGFFGAKEKCDYCGDVIVSPPYIIGKEKKLMCSKCKTGKNLVEANQLEEKKMKKAAKEKESVETKKIAGHLLPGTAIADLYTFLEDQKKHTIKDATKAMAKHKADKMGRMRQLGRYGKRFGGWAISIDTDEGTIQMKLGKNGSAPPAKAKKKDEEEEAPVKKGKAAVSKKDSAPAEKEPTNSKGLAATQRLVRGLLKAGKDWTRNKLVEHLSDAHEIDAKRSEAAIQAEIEAGGITISKGKMQLT